MADVKISQLPAATTPVSGTEELPLVQSGVTKKIALSDLSSISFGTTGLTPATATSGAVVVAGTLDVNNGGTGLATLTANNVILGNGTSTPTFVAPSTSGNVLTSNGTTWVSSVPATSGTVTSVNVSGGTTGLTTSGGPITSSGVITLAGTLAVANGGTGLSAGTSGGVLAYTAAGTLTSSAALTQYGVVYGGGAGAVPVATAAGTTGQVLQATTGGAPVWGSTYAGTVTSVAQSFTGGLISVAGSPITTSGTLSLTVAGTSGGVPYFSSGTTWATSAALAASALVIGGGAGAAPSTTTTGTGVVTALGVNVGTAGAFVVNGGALGTPSSGTVTNLTGTASININGTVGATTANTGAFTTVSATTSVTTPSVMTSGATALLLRPNGVTRMTIGTDGDPITTAVPLAVTGTLSATGATTLSAQLTASTGDGTYPIISKDTRAFSVGVTGPQLGFFGLDSTSTNNSLGAFRALAQSSQNGTLEARVLASGSIATIGTFSSTGLAVTGTLSATGTLSGGTSGTAYSFSGSAPATSLTLDASGSLLVGTTTVPTTGGIARSIVSIKQLNDTSYTSGIQIEANANTNVFGIGYNGSTFAIGTTYRSTGSYVPISFFTSDLERARIDSSGNLLVGTTSVVLSGKLTTSFTGNSINGATFDDTGNGNGAGFIIFSESGTAIGSISRVASTSAVAYNTTSDYRLKTVIAAVTGQGARIDALKPIDYQWTEGGQQARGFLAHEFQEVYASSVTGAKDAVDVKGKPVYQSMQASTAEVIADLVAELQSLRARVAQLESKP